MKQIILFDGARYRLIDRKKRKAKPGQVHTTKSGALKMCKRTTKLKYYCYKFDGKGRYYVQAKSRVNKYPKTHSHAYMFKIRDTKSGKMIATIFNKELVDPILKTLNKSNNQP